LNVALYKFTYNLISALKGQGTMPEMVQVGNEITNGMLWDIARVGGEYDTDEQWDKLCRLLNSGLNAVKAVDGSIRTIVHIERGGDNGRSVFFFDKLKNREVQFDIIGLSYYSIWHGSISAFRNNVNDLALRYGKDIAVVETAHPYTTENGDDTPNATSFPYGSMLPEYPATIQGQANNLHSVISILKEAPDGRGIGVFYWQPDFIPVKGAGWKYGEGCEWDDQAMFDFKGYALWSLDVFKMHSPEA
jgi:arabinogalactan endo-1,4-beta-galactosidase